MDERFRSSVAPHGRGGEAGSARQGSPRGRPRKKGGLELHEEFTNTDSKKNSTTTAPSTDSASTTPPTKDSASRVPIIIGGSTSTALFPTWALPRRVLTLWA
eukprot:9477528-Pyramimonas_sp.AAC.1